MTRSPSCVVQRCRQPGRTTFKEAVKDANHQIHGITYLAEQAWKAKEKSHDVVRKDYATQARTLVVREARRGHLDIIKTGSVLKLLEGLLADQAG